MKQLKSNKGFTLIELVVVIAILGILAGIAIPRFMDATATARGARVIADMRTIDSSIMLYQAKTGNLPTNSASLITDAGTSAANPTTYALLASWPAPPTGTIKITTNGGKEKDITADASGKAYTIVNGRAALDTTTVDDLLAD